MNFRTQYDNDTSRFVSEPGSPEYFVYTEDENGNPVVSGKRNIQDEIQSHKESCDISVLLERYALTGDDSLLNVKPGSYADMADAPSNIRELQERIRSAERYFGDLPEDLRDQFHNDPFEYFGSIGSGEFMEKIINWSRTKQEKSSGRSSNNNPAGDVSKDYGSSGGVNDDKQESE